MAGMHDISPIDSILCVNRAVLTPNLEAAAAARTEGRDEVAAIMASSESSNNG